MSEQVNHPQHYGGGDNPYEVIKVLEAWGLDENFCLGNVIKYVARADKKNNNVEDLEKALWYLDREITKLKGDTQLGSIVEVTPEELKQHINKLKRR